MAGNWVILFFADEEERSQTVVVGTVGLKLGRHRFKEVSKKPMQGKERVSNLVSKKKDKKVEIAI